MVELLGVLATPSTPRDIHVGLISEDPTYFVLVWDQFQRKTFRKCSTL